MKRTQRLPRSVCHRNRAGKVLVLLAVLVPTLVIFVGLVMDGSLLMSTSRDVQHATDAAACAAAFDIAQGSGDPTLTANELVCARNSFTSATVTVHVPPSSGTFAGNSNFVEVAATFPYAPKFARLPIVAGACQVATRSVAGVQPATDDAAIVILDPDPPAFAVAGVPVVLPALPSIVAGLEVLGLGTVRVNGSVLVNTTWKGLDENGDPVGEGNTAMPPHAVSCTPLLPLTRLRCPDLWVVGGVDNPDNYQDTVASEPSPLQANRRPVPDPYISLPVPTTSVDATNVSATQYGHVTVLGLPLLPATVLRPGVYQSLQVIEVAGLTRVTFMPGVYIIRGVNPVTQIGLNLQLTTLKVDGVTFYITNSTGYSATTGLPDSTDGETVPAASAVASLIPSAVVTTGLLGSRLSPLDDPGSPFDGLLLFQRRADRRPIVFVQANLGATAPISGNVYAKWGHLIISGIGRYRSAFVCGTLRFLDVLDCRIEPDALLPPAKDVFLVE